jgi:hypothetical protein
MNCRNAAMMLSARAFSSVRELKYGESALCSIQILDGIEIYLRWKNCGAACRIRGFTHAVTV